MDFITQYILPVALASIMFSLGLTLTVTDFARIVRFPTAVLIGLFSILIMMPLVGFLLASTLTASPILAVGLVLVAACPGGMFSNLFAYAARANLALSLSLTGVASLSATVTLPLIANVALDAFLGEERTVYLPYIESFLRIFALSVLPVCGGMALHAKTPKFSAMLQPFISRISGTLVVVIFAALIIDQFDTLMSSFDDIAGLVIILNMAGVTLAFLLSSVTRLPWADKGAIMLEHSIKQEGMGIFLAATLLKNTEMTLPLLMNSFVGAIFGLTLLFVFRHKGTHFRRKEGK